ncbi:MAG TPA: hypothetical protein VKG65_02275, partial [Terriglobales bacterium]|nr:hypothetical protein [Terriglobales bacterium]
LARRHRVVRSAGFRNYRSGPSPCYEFVHVLYREVVYGRIGSARRRKLHKSVAEAAEALALHVFSEAEVAAELAYQFEEGGDWPRAVKYLLLAADTAGRRFETRQAAVILEHGLELVNKIPEAERAQSEIAILEKLANIYQASYDPRAVETYEALAGRAAHYGLADVEVRARLGMAVPLAWVSADGYVEAVERALDAQRRSGEGGTLKQAAMRSICVCWRMGAAKWEPGDLEEIREMVAKLREAGDRHLLAELQLTFSYSLFHFSEYREAQRSAEEGFAMRLEGHEQNPYLSSNFQVHAYLVSSCLLFIGEWGEALRQMEHRIAMAEKNGDHQSAIIAGLERPRGCKSMRWTSPQRGKSFSRRFLR